MPAADLMPTQKPGMFAGSPSPQDRQVRQAPASADDMAPPPGMSAPAPAPAPVTTKLVDTKPAETYNGLGPSGSKPPEPQKGLSTGAKVGIGILAALVLSGGVWLAYRAGKKGKRRR